MSYENQKRITFSMLFFGFVFTAMSFSKDIARTKEILSTKELSQDEEKFCETKNSFELGEIPSTQDLLGLQQNLKQRARNLKPLDRVDLLKRIDSHPAFSDPFFAFRYINFDWNDFFNIDRWLEKDDPIEWDYWQWNEDD